MVGARSLAMALNRLIDAGIDARNPRTARRELPAGLLTPVQVAAFAAASLAVFLVAVWQLPPITHVLWPIPVAGVRHLPVPQAVHVALPSVLGAVDGLAPVGGWVAVTGTVDWQPFLLGGAVALLDRRLRHHLRDDGPRGRPRARACTRSRAGSASAPRSSSPGSPTPAPSRSSSGSASTSASGPLYWLGLAVVAVLLAYENSIVSEDDLSRVDMAFLQMNGVIAMVFLAGVLADALA